MGGPGSTMALRRKEHTAFLGVFFITLSVIAYLFLKNDAERASALLIPSEPKEKLPDCLAVITGDLEGAKALEQLTKSSKATASSRAVLPNVTEDCGAYVASRGYSTRSLSEEERNFPIAYSMVIHEKVGMFERLLRAIYQPQNVYCVHVDRKSPPDFLHAVSTIVSCFPNVFIASRLERVFPATWSRVQADLNCMRDLLRSPVRWRYLLNTCGADFPIKTNAETVTALKMLRGRNSMESRATNPNKRKYWMYSYTVTDGVAMTHMMRKSAPPIRIPMYQGNDYFVGTRGFVRHVMEDPEIQAFVKWEKDTFAPGEHLWATLQRMPSVPGSEPPNQNYDRSDMLSVARLVKRSYLEGDVSKGSAYPPCAGTHSEAVCLFGLGDLRWVFQQHHLMATKFDPEVNDVSITCMEAYHDFKAQKAHSR